MYYLWQNNQGQHALLLFEMGNAGYKIRLWEGENANKTKKPYSLSNNEWQH
jgi:hypothetical protein